MYLQLSPGLGQFETKDGDRAGHWLCQGMVPGGIARPDEGARVIGLRVTFRRSFADFHREVQRAVGRWVSDSRLASKFVTASEKSLKGHHKQMLAEKVPDNAPVRLFGSFFYTAQGCTWSVAGLKFSPERARWERIAPTILRWSFR